MSKVEGLRAALRALSSAGTRTAGTDDELDRLRAQLGAIESRLIATLGPTDIGSAEFQVFSQFGEDGIIQFLVQRVPIENEIFVEFGVGDYRESNTRFLLVHDNWRGLIMDSGESMQEFLRSTGLAWRHDIVAKTAFIDRDNINDLIRTAGFEGDIGLLSIDLDGNDYWILDAIDVVTPRIIVAEYKSTFGVAAAVTVPYDASFVRGEKHWSWLYGGGIVGRTGQARRRARIRARVRQSSRKQRLLRPRDLLGDIPEVDVAEAYSPSRFRESRDRAGELSYVSSNEQRLRLMAELPLVDLESGREVTVAERFGLGETVAP